MASNNISFTSKINFVDTKTFDAFRRGRYIDFRRNCNFLNLENGNSGWLKKNLRSDIIKADEFYTEEIRTCSAGGVINSQTGECAGFHIYDNLTNFENIDNILANIFSLVKNPDRALLLGSKNLKFSIYSIDIFDKLYEGLSKKIKNITLLREHLYPYSESDIHYSIKNDTWTIHSMYREKTNIKNCDLLSNEDLKKCFKEINLADGDSINFA